MNTLDDFGVKKDIHIELDVTDKFMCMAVYKDNMSDDWLCQFEMGIEDDKLVQGLNSIARAGATGDREKMVYVLLNIICKLRECG